LSLGLKSEKVSQKKNKTLKKTKKPLKMGKIKSKTVKLIRSITKKTSTVRGTAPVDVYNIKKENTLSVKIGKSKNKSLSIKKPENGESGEEDSNDGQLKIISSKKIKSGRIKGSEDDDFFNVNDK